MWEQENIDVWGLALPSYAVEGGSQGIGTPCTHNFKVFPSLFYLLLDPRKKGSKWALNDIFSKNGYRKWILHPKNIYKEVLHGL